MPRKPLVAGAGRWFATALRNSLQQLRGWLATGAPPYGGEPPQLRPAHPKGSDRPSLQIDELEPSEIVAILWSEIQG